VSLFYLLSLLAWKREVGLREGDEQLEHIFDKPAKRAVRGLADLRRMRRDSQESGTACFLDRLASLFVFTNAGITHRWISQRPAASPATVVWLEIG
jgi:hypothetical protein